MSSMCHDTLSTVFYKHVLVVQTLIHAQNTLLSLPVRDLEYSRICVKVQTLQFDGATRDPNCLSRDGLDPVVMSVGAWPQLLPLAWQGRQGSQCFSELQYFIHKIPVDVVLQVGM